MSKILEGEPAEARLAELGLPGSQVLVEAVRYGAAAARNTVELHPTAYRGYRMWAETTYYLRAELPTPWEPATDHGVELVLSRPHGVGIVVTKGNVATADPGTEPQVHYERGEAIQRLVNGWMDTLFDLGPRPRWQAWFLLHRLLPESSCAAELSRPIAVDGRGVVAGWAERILLPTEEPGLGTGVPASPLRPAPEIEVPVARRSV